MFFDSIKNDIREKLKLYNHHLSQIENWKRSHYIILSEIINEELENSEELQGEKKFKLGNSISFVTLQRFFKKDYSEEAVHDLRFLKTVDKLCIFLAFKDFGDYSTRQTDDNPSEVTKENSVVEDSTDVDEEFFISQIKDYNQSEFDSLKKSPEIFMEEIDRYIFPDSPLRMRVLTTKELIFKNKIQLVTENNASNYQVYDIKLISKTDEECICEAKEFWYLVFHSTKNKETFIYNETNLQTYFFRKIKGKWKIWNNSNPGSGQVKKLAEINSMV